MASHAGGLSPPGRRDAKERPWRHSPSTIWKSACRTGPRRSPGPPTRARWSTRAWPIAPRSLARKRSKSPSPPSPRIATGWSRKRPTSSTTCSWCCTRAASRWPKSKRSWRAHAADRPRREGRPQGRLRMTAWSSAPGRMSRRIAFSPARNGRSCAHDTPMTLEPSEVSRLHSMHDRLDISEVEEIYLPLSRLLSLYVAATQRLFRAQQGFLGTEDAKMPYIIGVGGSVAVGKSTTARVLQALLARWPNVPKVDLVTTDGFLYPNAVLEREGLMEKKGFPGKLRPAGAAALSVRHQGRTPSGARAGLFASDLRRHSEPMDRDRPAGHPDRRGSQRSAGRPFAQGRQGRFPSSPTSSISRSISMPTRTCCCRGTSIVFLTLRGTAFVDPKSYFHRYAKLSDEEAIATATSIWTRINLRQSAREYSADAAACRSHPEEGRKPPGRGSGAAPAVTRRLT